MKKITLLLGIGFASLVGTAQTISSFPYNEDFEGMANGTTLNGGWQQSTLDDRDWTVDVNGTTSGSTGPSSPTGGTTGAADHNPGIVGGKYIYCETSFPSGTGDDYDLLSPFFNLTALSDAKLDFWYHAFGSTMGNMNIEARIGTQGVWANIGGPITDNVNMWQNASICFGPTYAGNDSVQVKFTYKRGTSFGGDMALDDISVLPINPFDVGVTAVTGASGCGLTATETLDITICNFGDSLIPGTLVPVSISVGGAPAIVNTFILINGLASTCNNGCVTLTTSQTFDLSATGTYNIVATSDLAGDISLLNNAGSGSVTNLLVAGSLPYFEDFESGQANWNIDNSSNGSFDFGTPAGAVITGAASGDSAFATNLTGLYNGNDYGMVTSACIDISTATGDEVVAMKIWWSTENSWDGANLFASYDAGVTWDQVGNDNDPNNWYNDATINANPQGVGEGWSGDNFNGSAGWVVAQHELDSAKMVDNTGLLLRVGFGSDGGGNREGFAFDDIAIGLPTHTYEYGVAGIDSVIGSCGPFVLDAGAGHQFVHYSDLNNNFNGTWTNASTLTVTNTGTYVITVTNAMGMMATDTVFVEVLDFEPPVLVDVVDCTPGAIAAFDAGSGPIPANLLFAWGTGITTQTDTLYALGTIYVTKTDTALGCSASDTAVFVDEPIFTLGNDTNFCADDSIVLYPGLALSYLWTGGTTLSTLTVSTAGDYEVTITDAFGCVGSDTITISIDALPVVDLGIDTLFCVGNIGTLDAGAGASYLWNDGTTAQTLAPTASGIYSVTVTDANGCMGTDETVIVISTCVGVDELSGDTEVRMYPNPTKGALTIEFAAFNTNVVMNVLNIYGQVVRTGRLTSATTVLDLNDLSDGTYILQLQSENSITTNKFIINR